MAIRCLADPDGCDDTIRCVVQNLHGDLEVPDLKTWGGETLDSHDVHVTAADDPSAKATAWV
jgi:hypothetical protein